MNIMTWQTWKRRNNPRIGWCRDGVNPYVVNCIGPTLLDYGFSPCGEDDEYFPKTRDGKRTPRQIARELAETYGVPKGYDEFVYYVHAPSANYYTWILHLYGRMAERTVK